MMYAMLSCNYLSYHTVVRMKKKKEKMNLKLKKNHLLIIGKLMYQKRICYKGLSSNECSVSYKTNFM